MFVAVSIGNSAVYIINPGKIRPFERKEGDAKCQAVTTGEVAASYVLCFYNSDFGLKASSDMN